MNPIALCPDDLLARARRGQASGADRQKLGEHLRGCAICRLAFRFAVELDEDAVAIAGDDLMIRRLAERSVARVRAGAPRPGRHEVPVGSRRGWLDRAPWRRRALPAAAFLVFAAGAAAAAAWLSSSAPPRSSPPDQNVHQMPGVTSSGGPALPRVAPPPRIAPPTTTPTPPTPPTPTTVPSHESTPAPAHAESAGLWLRRARQARAHGDRARAVTLYRALQQRFPRSAEAVVSHVSLGTLLLEVPDGARPARVEFDTYLSLTARGAADGGTLKEEALAGRAQAQAALGDRAGEAETWRRLIEAFPDSLHAPLARQRLGGLAR